MEEGFKTKGYIKMDDEGQKEDYLETVGWRKIGIYLASGSFQSNFSMLFLFLM